MKRCLFVIIFVSTTLLVNSQIVFNKIIEDTVAHITSSVIALDTGYIFLSGTNNEDLVRCFALTYVDSDGIKVWKRTKSDVEFELWEGYFNCLKKESEGYNMNGLARNVLNDTSFVYIYNFSPTFEVNDSIKIKYDTLFKRAFSHIKSSDNCYYIVGQTYNYDIENYELLLIKVDSNKNIVWEKSYGNRYEAGFEIIETSDDNILIGGLTFSFPTSITDQDWYLLKVDTAGNVIWEKGYGNGSIYDDAVTSVIETQDSNYIACGSYPVFEAAMTSYYDGCLRKVSIEGELMWTRYYRMYSYYRSDGDITFKCSLSSTMKCNNDIIVIGNSYGPYPQYRGFMLKADQFGNIKWNRHYYAIDSSSSRQYINSIKPTNDGGFILAGYGNHYEDFGYNPPQQAWLIKTDSLGLDGLCNTETPELNFDIEFPESICRNDTIEVYAYIAGKSAPYTIEFSSGQIIDSIFYPPLFVPIEIGLSETSVEVGGIEYYSEQITEATLSNHEWGQCIAKPIEYYSPSYAGDITIQITVTDAYGESKTITKNINIIDCGDLVEQENICPVKLYPNPTIANVYVDIPQEIVPESAEIYNTAGQLIKSVSFHKGLNVLNVSDFAVGNYILKINTEDKCFSLSFEKE